MTYSLDLHFRDFSKETLRVYDAIAQIHVKINSSDEPDKDEKGHIFITSECVSIGEFEHEIERLKQELEKIKKEASKKFTEVNDRIKNVNTM